MTTGIANWKDEALENRLTELVRAKEYLLQRITWINEEADDVRAEIERRAKAGEAPAKPS